ncbi:hypothetical protein Fot_52615 [Forsythia ovata]|uniref:DUF7780 domain-containing protein n=1 Tax=Forsythia ovata TaxID=205694 RepID=A0ABD1PL78_9LAMI
MGITGKKKSSNSGMGFLFVFVPEEDNNSFRPFHSLLKRTNSSNLLQKAQSTISICVLLFFFTLLLFTLSTLPPTTPTPPRPHYFILPRRHLSATPKPSSSSSSISPRLSHALQGVGSLYRRGTSSMSDLIVAHAVESLTCYELKLFLRLLYRSSLSSRSDLAFIFPSKSAAFDNIILEENDAFLKLATQYGKLNHSTQLMESFDVAQFMKSSKKGNETGEPIWGRRIRSNSSEKMETESKWLSYGSVVGFDVQELDPDNSLAGFLDPDNSLPMSLRRWACYPMLLGRVRRNFKHILLVDIKEITIIR